MLSVIVIITFVLAAVLSVGLAIYQKYASSKTANSNPQFWEFQKIYFIAFYPALFADWLNAPYVYKLFSHYGFLEDQITIIYVCGLVSALFFGTSSGYLIHIFNEQRVALAASAVYALACFLKLSSDYSTLIISRILSGAATTLLFSSHETWYARSHLEVLDFPKDWIEITSTKAAFASSFMAAMAGILAYCMTELYGLGPVAPSLMAVPFLCIGASLMRSKWNSIGPQALDTEGLIERPVTSTNANAKKPRFVKTCCEGLQNIFRNPDLLIVGCVQSLFESVLSIFVFLWTPVLDHHNPPLGIVFASFMFSTLCGGIAYKIWTTALRIPANSLLVGATGVASIAILGCVMSTSPTNEFPVVSYLCFLIFEFAAGAYFPSMADMKRQVKPDLQNFAVTAWFRVPLNLFACFGLLMLHNSLNAHGTRKLFTLCFFMTLSAMALSLLLFRMRKSRSEKVTDGTAEET